MRRLQIYIAGPISKGDLASNIQRASDTFEVLALAGFAPVCPHWSCFSGPVKVTQTGGAVYAVAGAQPNRLTHADWLAVHLEYVRRSDAVLRLAGESTGADMEVAEAQRVGMPVFHSVESLQAWAAGLNREWVERVLA